MTVKDRTGRRRYVFFEEWSAEAIKSVVREFPDSRAVNYKGLMALRISHAQLPSLRQKAVKYGMKIRLVSGTLKSLKEKVSEL